MCECIGGTSVQNTIEQLRRGCQVVVGTPGRVYDMLSRRALKTDSMKAVILDEADDMLSK